jgi:hypothetical protein
LNQERADFAPRPRPDRIAGAGHGRRREAQGIAPVVRAIEPAARGSGAVGGLDDSPPTPRPGADQLRGAVEAAGAAHRKVAVAERRQVDARLRLRGVGDVELEERAPANEPRLRNRPRHAHRDRRRRRLGDRGPVDAGRDIRLRAVHDPAVPVRAVERSVRGVMDRRNVTGGAAAVAHGDDRADLTDLPVGCRT